MFPFVFLLWTSSPSHGGSAILAKLPECLHKIYKTASPKDCLLLGGSCLAPPPADQTFLMCPQFCVARVASSGPSNSPILNNYLASTHFLQTMRRFDIFGHFFTTTQTILFITDTKERCNYVREHCRPIIICEQIHTNKSNIILETVCINDDEKNVLNSVDVDIWLPIYVHTFVLWSDVLNNNKILTKYFLQTLVCKLIFSLVF